MVEQLAPLHRLHPAHRWAIGMGLGCTLWILPLALKAPRLAIFLALPSSVVSLAWASRETQQWELMERFDRRDWALADAEEAFRFGAKEEWVKSQVLSLLFPSAHGPGSNLEPELEPRTEPVEPTLLESSTQERNPERNPWNPVEPKLKPRAEPVNWTRYSLPKVEAQQLIQELSAQGLTKEVIIQELWGATKGGSKKYREALSEYQQLMEGNQ